MLKFYKALNFWANKINDHEILKKSIYEKKHEYFPNATIDFFLIIIRTLFKCQGRYLAYRS